MVDQKIIAARVKGECAILSTTVQITWIKWATGQSSLGECLKRGNMKGDIPKWTSCEGNMYRSRGTRLRSQCVPIYGGIHVFWPQWFFSFRSVLPFPAVVDTAFLIRSDSVHVDESYLSNEEKCTPTIKYHLSFANSSVTNIVANIVVTMIISMQENWTIWELDYLKGLKYITLIISRNIYYIHNSRFK